MDGVVSVYYLHSSMTLYIFLHHVKNVSIAHILGSPWVITTFTVSVYLVLLLPNLY